MLQHTTLYVALGIPYLDSAYPYIVHQPPSSPVTTQSYVTIIVSDIPNSPPCMARIERINRIGLGYIIFDISHCQYDIRQVAMPLEWVHLSRFERIYHWRGLWKSRSFRDEYLEGGLVSDAESDSMASNEAIE